MNMTINVCVINKEEISVGADDRKTINNMKTFDNVKKIFTPYENWSMVMTMNGPAKFEGRSFENLSEEFKEKQDKNVLKTVENTTYNFLEFLNQTDMDTTDIDVFVNFNLIKFKNKISHELKNCNEKNFNYFIKNVKKHEILPFLLDKDINFDYIIPDFVVNKSEVEEILLKHFSYFIFINSTEVIITGFDEDTRLPSIISFRLFAKTNNSVEYEFSIFETQIKKGLIFTFADDGEVKILFNGIDPNIEENIYSILDFLLCKNRIDFLNFLIDSQNFDTETIKEFNN